MLFCSVSSNQIKDLVLNELTFFSGQTLASGHPNKTAVTSVIKLIIYINLSDCLAGPVSIVNCRCDEVDQAVNKYTKFTVRQTSLQHKNNCKLNL